MKLAMLIPLPLLFAACATKHAAVLRVHPYAVPGTTLPSEGVESVRYAEDIKGYPLGRYIDPNNSRIMHEGHTVYRVETTAKWNLHPNAPVVVPLGAATRVRDVSQATAPLRDELTMELNRQRQVTQSVIHSGETVSQKLEQLSAAMEQTRHLAEQNTQLQQEMNTTTQRLNALEEELRRKQRAERTTTPAATPKEENSEW
jgi:regulator of replication initiation timing